MTNIGPWTPNSAVADILGDIFNNEHAADLLTAEQVDAIREAEDRLRELTHNEDD